MTSISIQRKNDALEVHFTVDPHEPDRLPCDLQHNELAASVSIPHIERITGESFRTASQLPENTALVHNFNHYATAEQCWLIYAVASRAFENGAHLSYVSDVIDDLAARTADQETLDKHMDSFQSQDPDDVAAALDAIIEYHAASNGRSLATDY